MRSLDPPAVVAFPDIAIAHLLYDTLVGYGPASAVPAPALAEHWEISPDGTVYTFTLRPGITYSDGTPIVADDFVYALERVRTGSSAAAFLTGIKGVRADGPRRSEWRRGTARLRGPPWSGSATPADS